MTAFALAGAAGCATSSVATQRPACSEAAFATFQPDELTRAVAVRSFQRGEPLAISEPVTEMTPRAAADLCVVKLLVGPGNPGPVGAPSTSAGIGIEIWLPTAANWNGRIHAWGGGGWVGGSASIATEIGGHFAAGIAGREGAVSSVTDAGHAGTDPGQPSSGGAFAMNPDGSINTVLWEDFASRSLHEQALKTEALTTFFYGRPASYSYWDGSSTGGRQALNLAQNYPDDFDGIIANMPALYWSNLSVSGMYAQILFQRDLDGNALSEAQLDLPSTRAIAACDLVGGVHLGYIMDSDACRYDPARDREVLCVSDGGARANVDCLTRAQAGVINKIWFGPTRDSSAPAPANDNGSALTLDGNRLWYGLPRGTSLYNAHYSTLYHVNAGWAGASGPWTLVADQLALQLQDPRIAAPSFRNASGDGADGWKHLRFDQLANAFESGVALQADFAHINTDNPDLSAFRARGGRMLGWHGGNDEVIPVQQTMRYYDSVAARMGGVAAVQDFYRLYIVPGNGHGPYNGTANPNAEPPALAGGQLYNLLVDWVERSAAPGQIEISNTPEASVRRSAPLCAYPQRATYVSGNPNAASSFVCR